MLSSVNSGTPTETSSCQLLNISNFKKVKESSTFCLPTILLSKGNEWNYTINLPALRLGTYDLCAILRKAVLKRFPNIAEHILFMWLLDETFLDRSDLIYFARPFIRFTKCGFLLERRDARIILAWKRWKYVRTVIENCGQTRNNSIIEYKNVEYLYSVTEEINYTE